LGQYFLFATSLPAALKVQHGVKCC